MGEHLPPGLRSNAAPHQTPVFLLIELFISTPIAARLTTPPIEAATDAITVTLSPKVVTKTRRIRIRDISNAYGDRQVHCGTEALGDKARTDGLRIVESATNRFPLKPPSTPFDEIRTASTSKMPGRGGPFLPSLSAIPHGL